MMPEVTEVERSVANEDQLMSCGW